jgi:Cu/Ag efflux protein CusF
MLHALALAGCASYQPPPLTVAHPAHPEAPAARVGPASRTLAYTPSDAEAVRALARPAPPPGAAAKTVVGEGEVVATTPASGQIVVDHAEIKGFMEAMTMGYRTDPPSLPATVKPGDKIRFTIDVDRRAIVHIEKLP